MLCLLDEFIRLFPLLFVLKSYPMLAMGVSALAMRLVPVTTGQGGSLHHQGIVILDHFYSRRDLWLCT